MGFRSFGTNSLAKRVRKRSFRAIKVSHISLYVRITLDMRTSVGNRTRRVCSRCFACSFDFTWIKFRFWIVSAPHEINGIRLLRCFVSLFVNRSTRSKEMCLVFDKSRISWDGGVCNLLQEIFWFVEILVVDISSLFGVHGIPHTVSLGSLP